MKGLRLLAMDVVMTFFAAMVSVFFGVCALVSMCICCTTSQKSKPYSSIGCTCCRKDPEEFFILPGKQASPRMVSGQDEMVVSYSAGSASKTAAVFHFPSIKPLAEKSEKQLPNNAGSNQDASKPESTPKDVNYSSYNAGGKNSAKLNEVMVNRKFFRSMRERMSCFGLSCLHHSQSLPSLLQVQEGSNSHDLEGSSIDDICSRFDSSVLSFNRENSYCTERSLSVVSGDEFLSLVLSPDSRSSLWCSATSDSDATLSRSPSSTHSFFSMRSTRTLASK